MLRIMSNSIVLGNALRAAMDRLRERLPSGWEIILREPGDTRDVRDVDGVLELSAPDGTGARVVVDVKGRFTAAQAATSGPRLERIMRATAADTALIVADYLSALARTRLREQNVSYVDATGNTWLTLDRPAVWLEGRGADQDPAPPQRGVRSLKGGKAGRIVRALCDWVPTVGVRELAGRAEVDPGYTTRVLSFLADEDVIRRDDDGGVAEVLWKDLLRRWARDYRAKAAAYLAPRGLEDLSGDLRSFPDRYALTGSMAVPAEADVAPARLMRCYVDDPEVAAQILGLRRADAGANVLLLEPIDPVVYERTRVESGLVMAALSQCVVDLMTGSGREPNEGEALMSWMEANEPVWRG